MAKSNGLTGADPGIGQDIERVIVLGAHHGNRERIETELDELEELARTLGVHVADRALVGVHEPHPATFFRGGAVDTLTARIADLDRPAVVCNNDLTPRQQHNLEQAWGVPVLDRTEIILAIFARRAHTAEGKIQVEMAQLEHMLPRLAGGWSHLERQRGGGGAIGLRAGPGETQIEVDRRLIRQRISRLKKKLEKLEQQRSLRRQKRNDVPLTSCALVGYTNAGKSTLLNHLTHSEVFADNLLFATLDPTSRRLHLGSGRTIILTDTVGFIQSLPTELVEAFAATLEEVRQAHLLLIVVDASHPDRMAQLETVLQTLNAMECEQPNLVILNKIDRMDPAEVEAAVEDVRSVTKRTPLCVSALKGTGLKELREALDQVTAGPVAAR